MPYVIKIGNSGDLVKTLQKKLVEKGLLPEYDSAGKENVDGKFGRITQDAVISFWLNPFKQDTHLAMFCLH